MQSAWNAKAYFLEKKKKNDVNLSSAELALRVLNVKTKQCFNGTINQPIYYLVSSLVSCTI